MVRCAVLCPCGSLRDDEQGTAVTVPTRTPNRWEVDPQPEPDQATWAKLSITVERSDGGIVDAEIIRPRSWILRNGICAGSMLPLNLPELEVSGLALVTSIDDCPPIACGEGSVVTARFVTREVNVVASVDVLGTDAPSKSNRRTTLTPKRFSTTQTKTMSKISTASYAINLTNLSKSEKSAHIDSKFS